MEIIPCLSAGKSEVVWHPFAGFNAAHGQQLETNPNNPQIWLSAAILSVDQIQD